MPPSPNITSPLIDDVLREIFITCCTESPQNLSKCFAVGDRKSIRDVPQLSVSRVCSSWRHVALFTPQLWDSIMIRDFTNTNLSTARKYLSRAKNLPVSITFGQRRLERSQLMDFLSSYRLRALTVYPNGVALDVLPDLSQWSVAGLESLTILDGNVVASIDLNGTRYPKLAVVHIRGTCTISGYSTSLRIFDGKGLMMTVAESWDFLSRCPSLEEASLAITIRNTRRPESVPLIQLQYLRFLGIYSDCDPVVNTFIEALALPVLEELRVHNARLVWSSTAFQSFSHRSNYFTSLYEIRFLPLISVP